MGCKSRSCNVGVWQILLDILSQHTVVYGSTPLTIAGKLCLAVESYKLMFIIVIMTMMTFLTVDTDEYVWKNC